MWERSDQVSRLQTSSNWAVVVLAKPAPVEQIELGVRLNAENGVAARFLFDNCISHSAWTNFERNKNPEKKREKRRNNSVEANVALSYDAALRTQSVYFLSLVYSSRHKRHELTYTWLLHACMTRLVMFYNVLNVNTFSSPSSSSFFLPALSVAHSKSVLKT